MEGTDANLSLASRAAAICGLSMDESALTRVILSDHHANVDDFTRESTFGSTLGLAKAFVHVHSQANLISREKFASVSRQQQILFTKRVAGALGTPLSFVLLGANVPAAIMAFVIEVIIRRNTVRCVVIYARNVLEQFKTGWLSLKGLRLIREFPWKVR